MCRSPRGELPSGIGNLAVAATWQWNGGVQFVLPWAIAMDVEYTGEHAYNVVENVDINAVDFGADRRDQVSTKCRCQCDEQKRKTRHMFSKESDDIIRI